MDTTHSTLSHQSYELLKILLDFIAAVMWPVTALVIIYLFQQEIKKLLLRTKKVELPGGISLETLDHEINQAKELSVEVKKERNPEIQKLINEASPSLKSEANKRMIELGLNPSPSGLNLNYYKRIIDSDPRLALLGLRSDIEIILKNIAKGFKLPIQDKDSSSKVLSLLFDNGALTSKQFRFIQTLLKICNSAAHGATVSKEQSLEVLDIGEVLIKDYIAWLSWGFKS